MSKVRLSVILFALLALAGSCSAADAKPKYDMAQYKTITEATLKLIDAKDYPAAEKKIVELEEKWDDGTKALKAADRKVWTVIDKQMDVAMEAVKAAKDAAGAEKAKKEINTFLTELAKAEKVK